MTDQRHIQNLTLLGNSMASQLKKARPDSPWPARWGEYVTKHHLSSPLREIAERPVVTVPVVVNGHPHSITVWREETICSLAINALDQAKVIDHDLITWVVTAESGEVLDQSRPVASIEPNTTVFISRPAGTGG